MRRRVLIAFAVTVGVVLMLFAGCQEAEAPSQKKSRLIAAENIELKKTIQQRDKEIESLKTRHAREIERQEKALEQCRKKTENCRKELEEKLDEKVKDVLGAMMDEMAELRAENEALKAKTEQP